MSAGPLTLPKGSTVLRAKRGFCRVMHGMCDPSMQRLRLPATRGGATLEDYEDMGPSTSSSTAVARECTLESYGIQHNDALCLDLLVRRVRGS